MFWNIFLNSLVLILAILFIGWGIARLIERSAKNAANDKGSTAAAEEE